MPESPDLIVRAVDVHRVRSSFSQAWKAGQRPAIKDFLHGASEVEQAELLRELLAIELQFRRQSGETIVADVYRKSFPKFAAVIDAVLNYPARGGGELAAAGDSCQDLDTGPAKQRQQEDQPASLGRSSVSTGNDLKRPW